MAPVLAHVPRPPLSLDPLIAEAKRRARRRRVLGAVLVLALAAGVVGAVVALSRPPQPGGPANVARTATRTPLPPLSGLAARAQLCFSAFNAGRWGGCHSPSRKWSVHVDHRIHCALNVSRIGTPRRAEVRVPGSCVPLLWVGKRFLIGEGSGPGISRVASLDPSTRRVRLLARLSYLIVSPDLRWIAGEGDSRLSSYGARVIAVMSLTSGTCRVVARSASPKEDISVWKSPWSFPVASYARYSRDPNWRTVRRAGRKIRVASGPGTGFTRNSRSLIIAKWRPARKPPYETHKRLLKFDLSSLHTPCPASLAPRG
jgi:hypothetical protein